MYLNAEMIRSRSSGVGGAAAGGGPLPLRAQKKADGAGSVSLRSLARGSLLASRKRRLSR